MESPYSCNVVIDLEFTQIPRRLRRGGLRNEIIEVAAVKLAADGSVLGEFSHLVKPTLSASVSGAAHRLTGIGIEDLTCAKTLPDVLRMLEEWIGPGRARMVTWSGTDKAQIDLECQVKGVEPGLPSRWLDIQRLYPRLMGTRKRLVALGEAADWCGIPHDRSSAHRALYDAQVTAEVFRMMASGECAAQRAALDAELTRKEPTTCSSSIADRCGGLAELFASLSAREAAVA